MKSDFSRYSAIIATIIGLAVPVPAHACGPVVEVAFEESAPKDLLSIRNRSEQPWTLNTLTFNLTTSRGNLIFDTEVGGSGENVAQPFEPLSGEAQLAAMPTVSDGDAVMLMLFRGFGPGRHFDFTIDLDDQLLNSEMGRTMISGSEIAGASVDGVMTDPNGRTVKVRGVFNTNNIAQLTALTCV